MQKIDAALSDYGAFHRTRGNKTCHFVGIPMIIFGILAMLRAIPLFNVDGWESITAAEALIAISFVFYLTLDARLALIMLVFSLLFNFAAVLIDSVWVGLAAFVIGWIFQGIGHMVFEKNSPAFLRNLVHLMIGPLFLLNEVFHVRPISLPAPASYSS